MKRHIKMHSALCREYDCILRDIKLDLKKMIGSYGSVLRKEFDCIYYDLGDIKSDCKDLFCRVMILDEQGNKINVDAQLKNVVITGNTFTFDIDYIDKRSEAI